MGTGHHHAPLLTQQTETLHATSKIKIIPFFSKPPTLCARSSTAKFPNLKYDSTLDLQQTETLHLPLLRSNVDYNTRTVHQTPGRHQTHPKADPKEKTKLQQVKSRQWYPTCTQHRNITNWHIIETVHEKIVASMSTQSTECIKCKNQ